MHIWIGIYVDEELADIKRAAQEIAPVIGFSHPSFTLPMHISLKMPFFTQHADAVVSAVSDYLHSTSAFSIPVWGLADEGCILWVKMGQCPKLNQMHDTLNKMLLKEFDICLHEYDGDYQFHATLFIDDDPEKIHAAYSMMQEQTLPKKLTANRFQIGISESGDPGSYQIVEDITV